MQNKIEACMCDRQTDRTDRCTLFGKELKETNHIFFIFFFLLLFSFHELKILRVPGVREPGQACRPSHCQPQARSHMWDRSMGYPGYFLIRKVWPMIVIDRVIMQNGSEGQQIQKHIYQLQLICNFNFHFLIRARVCNYYIINTKIYIDISVHHRYRYRIACM